jgi:hypothetical protein
MYLYIYTYINIYKYKYSYSYIYIYIRFNGVKEIIVEGLVLLLMAIGEVSLCEFICRMTQPLQSNNLSEDPLLIRSYTLLRTPIASQTSLLPPHKPLEGTDLGQGPAGGTGQCQGLLKGAGRDQSPVGGICPGQGTGRGQGPTGGPYSPENKFHYETSPSYTPTRTPTQASFKTHNR